MAATLDRAQEEVAFFSFPIEKKEDTEAVNPIDGTPDLLIWGKATDGTIDGDQEIVDPAWSAKAIQEWFDTKANIRMAHDPKRPVGKGVDIALTDDGHWVKALIADPLAKHFIRNGILNDYSVGISNPAFKYRDDKLDPLGKARRIITGHADGSSRISEVTVCDRGSNFNSSFALAKAAADGSCEFVGKMIGDPAEIAKAAPAALVKAAGIGADDDGDLVNVDVPKSASITFSPADLAKLGKHRKVAEQREDAALEAVKAAEVQVYKRDIDTATRRRLHSQGRALPNLSYPIETHEDAENAVTLALSGHGDVSAAKALIRRVAKKEGWQDILDRLDGNGGDASKGAAVSGEPAEVTINIEGTVADPAELAKALREGAAAAQPEVAKADPGDEDGDGAMHHDDGEDDDTDSDADALDKAATPKPKMSCGNCGKKCGAKARFCKGCGRPMTGAARASKASTPGEGVTGTAAADIQAAPEHREPDGPAFEAAERDAHMPTTPDPASCEVKAAARHRHLGVPYDQGWLHDILCPAYDPADVAKHYPHRDLSGVDTDTWQAKAFDLAAKAPLDQMGAAMDLFQHARTLKAVTPDLAHDILGEAHKAFRDANPGPASAPTPGEVSPARFTRPLITAGHAAPSPGHDAPHSNPVHAEHQSAAMHQRGPLTSGHAADSPGNANPRPEPVPAPAVPGVPSAVSTADIQRHNAAQAMSAMHDHIAASFPDLCPMYGPGHAGQQPSGARPVAPGVGGPVPHGAMKADSSEDMTAGIVSAEETRETFKADAAKTARKLEKRLRKARQAAGLPPLAAYQPQPVALKASTAQLKASVDPDVIKSAVADATSALAADLTATRTELAELRKVADAIADQPDPRVEAYRGPVLSKTPATAAPQPATAAGYEDRVRTSVVKTMYDQWRNSPIPELREEAWNFLLKEAGIDVTKNA